MSALAVLMFVGLFSVERMLSLFCFCEMQKSDMVLDSCTFVSFEQDTVLLFFSKDVNYRIMQSSLGDCGITSLLR